MQLLIEVTSKRIANTIVEHPPAYDPQSNGVAEKAVQETMEQLRAVNIALEQRLGVTLDTKSKLFDWALEHASLLISRYKVGQDGKTAYRR